MGRPRRTCPKCGTLLKYEEIMPKGASFPCPSCRETLQVSQEYLCLIWFAAIFSPALIFWALGLWWVHLIIAELVVIYPILYWSLRYVKYVIPPKLEVCWPRGPGLHLNDR